MLDDEFQDEEGVGSWMIAAAHKAQVENRIACPELGYHVPAALYASVEDFEKATGRDFYGDVCNF